MGAGYRKLVMLGAALLAVSIISGAVALYLDSGGNPPTQVLPPPSSESAGENAGASQRTTAGSDIPEIKVYVSGAVERPGVYRLEPGDRLVDAVERAGGAAPDAQLERVNLSLRVADQDHYHIPTLGDAALQGTTGVGRAVPGQAPAQGNGYGNDYSGDYSGDFSGDFSGDYSRAPAVIRVLPQDGRIDLNTAPPALLETLPGIGPVLAQAIVDYRESNGGFRSLEEVTNVPRIGPITYQKIRDLAKVSPVQ